MWWMSIQQTKPTPAGSGLVIISYLLLLTSVRVCAIIPTGTPKCYFGIDVVYDGPFEREHFNDYWIYPSWY